MWNSSPTDAKTHETAIAIARRCVWIIQAVLREEERIDAVREFYMITREELEKLRGEPGQPNAESSAAR
jgi:hypothetical protein